MLIENLPAGSVVTVTEVYSGASYTLVSEGTQTVTLDSSATFRVEFENDYTPTRTGGHGIVNHFEYSDESGWGWTQLDDNG